MKLTAGEFVEFFKKSKGSCNPCPAVVTNVHRAEGSDGDILVIDIVICDFDYTGLSLDFLTLDKTEMTERIKKVDNKIEYLSLKMETRRKFFDLIMQKERELQDLKVKKDFVVSFENFTSFYKSALGRGE